MHLEQLLMLMALLSSCVSVRPHINGEISASAFQGFNWGSGAASAKVDIKKDLSVGLRDGFIHTINIGVPPQIERVQPKQGDSAVSFVRRIPGGIMRFKADFDTDFDLDINPLNPHSLDIQVRPKKRRTRFGTRRRNRH